MNLNNYGTQPACQRLVDNGIVLETDCYWVKEKTNECTTLDAYELMLRRGDWFIPTDPDYYYSGFPIASCDHIPAPSMAEVWWELPDEILHPSCGRQDHHELSISKTSNEETTAWYTNTKTSFDNINPTDALIDLLIWLTARKEGYEKTNL
jgi:hypothetical protein